MSLHKFALLLDVNDELLADHASEDGPPPLDVTDWDASDLLEAFNSLIANSYESELTYVGPATEEDRT